MVAFLILALGFPGLFILVKILAWKTNLFKVEHYPEKPWMHNCDQCHSWRETLYRPTNKGDYGWVCAVCVDHNIEKGLSCRS